MESLLNQLRSECKRLIGVERNVDGRSDVYREVAKDALKNILSLGEKIAQSMVVNFQSDGVFMPGELNYVKKNEIENPIVE